MSASADRDRLRHQYQKELDKVGEVAEQMTVANAANLGIRYALAAQLERVDPDNPILKDVLLLERLKQAILAGFEMSGRAFDACREVGKTFKIPGREGPAPQAPAPAPNLVKPPTLLNDPAELKMAYAGVLAIRNALFQQLKQVDPDHPLVKDIMLLERIRKAGVSAYVTSGENMNAARDVGDTFQIPGRS